MTQDIAALETFNARAIIAALGLDLDRMIVFRAHYAGLLPAPIIVEDELAWAAQDLAPWMSADGTKRLREMIVSFDRLERAVEQAKRDLASARYMAINARNEGRAAHVVENAERGLAEAELALAAFGVKK